MINAYGTERKAKMSYEKGKNGFILFLVMKNMGLERGTGIFPRYCPDPDLISWVSGPRNTKISGPEKKF